MQVLYCIAGDPVSMGNSVLLSSMEVGNESLLQMCLQIFIIFRRADRDVALSQWVVVSSSFLMAARGEATSYVMTGYDKETDFVAKGFCSKLKEIGKTVFNLYNIS